VKLGRTMLLNDEKMARVDWAHDTILDIGRGGVRRRLVFHVDRLT